MSDTLSQAPTYQVVMGSVVPATPASTPATATPAPTTPPPATPPADPTTPTPTTDSMPTPAAPAPVEPTPPKYVVVVTSIITPTGDNATVRPPQFTPEENLQQTLATIKSIRDRLGDASQTVIILSEGSNLSEEHKATLLNAANIILVPQKEEYVQEVNGINASVGDLILLRQALGYIAGNIPKFEHLIKVSGRWNLTPHFRPELLSPTAMSFKKVSRTFDPNDDMFFTEVFAVPVGLVSVFNNLLDVNLRMLLTYLQLKMVMGADRSFYMTFPRQAIRLIDYFGVSAVMTNKGLTVQF